MHYLRTHAGQDGKECAWQTGRTGSRQAETEVPILQGESAAIGWPSQEFHSLMGNVMMTIRESKAQTTMQERIAINLTVVVGWQRPMH